MSDVISAPDPSAAPVKTPEALAEEARVIGLKPKLAPAHERYGNLPHQVFDLWPAEDEDAPAVVLLHGGYWRYNRLHMTPYAAYLGSQGFRVYLPEYARSGMSESFEALYDDLVLFLDTVFDSGDYLLAGHCSGGQLALWCGTRRFFPQRHRWHASAGPRGILALAPITDLQNSIDTGLSDGAALAMLCGPDGMAEKLALVDPLTRLATYGATGVRTVLLYGTKDAEVPPAQFVHYAETHVGLRTVVLEDVGHYVLVEPGSAPCDVSRDLLRELFHDAR
ncbi:alpha/beta fold hydrolase [Mycobacterium sp.]|uniref:alpha/beta fold hydrolase n=1 Tax=Mycobacterium sp. TaxID=1785 RepID=UPI003BAA5280